MDIDDEKIPGLIDEAYNEILCFTRNIGVLNDESKEKIKEEVEDIAGDIYRRENKIMLDENMQACDFKTEIVGTFWFRKIAKTFRDTWDFKFYQRYHYYRGDYF